MRERVKRRGGRRNEGKVANGCRCCFGVVFVVVGVFVSVAAVVVNESGGRVGC